MESFDREKPPAFQRGGHFYRAACGAICPSGPAETDGSHPARTIGPRVRQLTVDLGVFDTDWGVILFQIAFQAGFCTFFMRNFIADLPSELVEAARAEGGSEWNILIHVIVPLVRPALAALAVFQFTFIWNDVFWPLILIQSDELRLITLGLTTLNAQYISSFNLFAAGSLIAALPAVMMFFAIQRHCIAGRTLGASKG